MNMGDKHEVLAVFHHVVDRIRAVLLLGFAKELA